MGLRRRWNKEIERDFIELKKAFTNGGIQAFPDLGVGDPFILTTDWSKENIAGVLSQIQERFLWCWGRKCNKYERNFTSCNPVYQEVETHIKLSS